MQAKILFGSKEVTKEEWVEIKNLYKNNQCIQVVMKRMPKRLFL